MLYVNTNQSSGRPPAFVVWYPSAPRVSLTLSIRPPRQKRGYKILRWLFREIGLGLPVAGADTGFSEGGGGGMR